MALDMDLAKRLKTYRTFKNLTQKEVAAHLNVPHASISDIENGKANPTIKTLEKLLDVLGMEINIEVVSK